MKKFLALFLLLGCFLHASLPIEKEKVKIGYLQLSKDKPINSNTFLAMKFQLDYFKKEGVDFILFEIDSPGGEVFPTLQIIREFRKLDQSQIPIIAAIDDWAISAGALLALGCRYIAVTPTASMGAAEPVVSSGGDMQSASEKVNSALRSEFINVAKLFGRNPHLAEAMVDKDVILVKRSDQIIQLDQETQIQQTDEMVSKKGKLLTLNAEQLLEWKMADFSLKHGVKESLFEHSFFSSVKDYEFVSYKDWRLGFFSFLSHPLIASMLVLGIILGGYIELTTPGFGIPGTVAISCLIFILLSSFALEAFHFLELILFGFGLFLLFIELFVTPGFGFMGIMGIVCMAFGLFALLIPNIEMPLFSLNTDSWRVYGSALSRYFVTFFLFSFFAAVGLWILNRYFKIKIPIFHRLVLHNSQAGFVSGLTLSELPSIGASAITITDFSPSGKIKMNDIIYHALSDDGFIEKNTPVQVIRHHGNQILIRRLVNASK